jgi:LPS export ABC transporter protein LptC/lipopolysaccharide transport protein LptA
MKRMFLWVVLLFLALPVLAADAATGMLGRAESEDVVKTSEASAVATAATVAAVAPKSSMPTGLPQQIEGLNLVGYSDGGTKSWDIKGDTADINGDQVKVTNVNANSYGDKDTNLKAKKGEIDRTTGNVNLQDDVVVTTEDGARMKTETLQWDRQENVVRTKDRVSIEDSNMKVEGDGMEAHPGLKAAKLEGNVTADIKAENKDKKKENRIQITSDGPMEIDQEKKIAVFTENVVAEEGASGRTLRADRMEVTFDAESRKIKELVCSGHVSVKQGNNVTYSDGLVYKADEQRMVLTGKPKLILDPGDHTAADAFKL